MDIVFASAVLTQHTKKEENRRKDGKADVAREMRKEARAKGRPAST